MSAAATKPKAKHVGVMVRHTRACPAATNKDARCRCKPSYRAEAYDKAAGKKIRETFDTLAAAKNWRHDQISGIKKGTVRAAGPTTLQQAWDKWIDGAESGAVLTRSNVVYKPSVLRSYRTSMRKRILDELGTAKLADIRRVHLQTIADQMLAEGCDPSTIRNTFIPIRALFRHALQRDQVTINPTIGLQLQKVEGRRDRVAPPAEMAKLIGALPIDDRALWACAAYAGLRRGELRALRFEDVDLAGGKLRVERSMDDSGALIAPKSEAGTRTVPIPSVLRDYLDEHKLRLARESGYVFGTSTSQPFTPSAVRRRARTAWKAANAKETKKAEEENRKPNLLTPIGLHECRHSYASMMIGGNVNAKALSVYMGHSSITITLDRYGHLMPGNEDEAAKLLDAYLFLADTDARKAQVEA